MTASAPSRRYMCAIALLLVGISCAAIGEASHHVSSQHLDTLIGVQPITNVITPGVNDADDALPPHVESHLRRRRNDEEIDNIFTARKGGGGSSSSKSKSSEQSSKSDSSKHKRKKKKKKKSRSNTDHRSWERMCRTSKEKSCRNSCIKKSCHSSDSGKDSPCYKTCRYKCCSDSKDSGSSSNNRKNKKKSQSSSEDRMCSTMAEKSCRSKCFAEEDCDGGDDCEKDCRHDCCSTSRSDKSKSKTTQKSKSKSMQKSKSKSTKKSKSKDDDSSKASKKSDKSKKPDKSKDKKKNSNNGGSSKTDADADSNADSDRDDDDDEPLCNTDVEKECRNDCYEESNCESGDKECRSTCRKGCCVRGESEVSVLDFLDADSDDLESSATSSADDFTGDLPIPFRFTINTSSQMTATDILFGRGNDLKRDIEGGLDLLVSEVVGEKFRNSDWKENKRVLLGSSRRHLLVEYQSQKPPTVDDVVDVPCPLNSVQSGACRRVSAEATLRIVDENSDDVRRAFLPTISDAIRGGGLEEKIREYNPDHGNQLQEEEGSNADQSTRGDGDSNGGMSNILIAGIAVAGFVALVLAYLGVREVQDRRRRKHERSIAESSVYNNTLQDEYGDPAYSQAQYAERGGYSESTSGPPIPPPPQLPDRSSTQLSKVRQDLQELQDSQYQYERNLEKGGPSLTDLVASSYSQRVVQDEYDGDDRVGYRGADNLSEISEEYQDGGNAARPNRNADVSAGSIDNYGDYDEPNPANVDPTSPDKYRDRDDAIVAIGTPAAPDSSQDYYERQQEDEEDGAHHHYQEQQMATHEESEYQQDYPEPPVATYTSSGYESPPDAAESDVSGGNEDDYTDSSSQRFVAMAKKMADEEELSSRRQPEHEDAIEGISDGSDDEGTAHSQAKAYRVRAQADKIGRKSNVSDLISRFESP